MAYQKNELNVKAMGGSELIAQRLAERIDPTILDQFQITLSRVRDLDESKYRILHLHDLPQDPESAHFKDHEGLKRFHEIVFCGHWQYNQYQAVHNLPYWPNIRVINNGIVPIVPEVKSKDEIRLIYVSTPQRGLELLVPVFEFLSQKYDNIHLDVFSSFLIYGWEEKDKLYEPLYQACRDHPKITYHGFQSNDVVREYMAKAHIFAYPSIWPECNSLSVIEAMSAGAMCVHPNYGGIIDGTGNLTVSYPWVADKNQHAQTFAGVLSHAIESVNTEETQNYLRFIKLYADQRYHIDKIAATWEGLMRSVIERNPDKELPKYDPSQFFEIKT